MFQHEADGFKKWVNKYDENKDGEISRAEFHKVFAHHRESHGLNKPQQLEFFDYLDHDNSGSLTEKELEADGVRMMKEFEAKWSSIDKNNDGQLSDKEVEAIDWNTFFHVGKVPIKSHHLDREFADFDKNNDGQVSKKDFMAMFQHEADGFKKWVNKYDENKDGKISRAEFSKVFKHHKKGKLVKKHKGKVVKKHGLKK